MLTAAGRNLSADPPTHSCCSALCLLQLQRDTIQALQQQPSNLVTSLVAAAAQQQQELLQALSKQAHLHQQHQQHGDELSGSGSAGCSYCQHGLGNNSSFCSCQAGGPASLRTPSATAASTAHVALLLASWGYRVIVRKVLHSKAYWTKSMDNTFIVALDSSSGSHVEYIVDPHFQEAFNVGVMSDNYRCVWAVDVVVVRGVEAHGWNRRVFVEGGPDDAVTLGKGCVLSAPAADDLIVGLVCS